ncbi:MAG: hypothetical protein FWG85_06720 [Bacteroidetes bacterium]|nr:hypothetical protein [Bacteroidota bacterium]
MIKKSVICLFCLMFLASANLYSQDTIRTPRDFADMVPNGSYILMYDITVTQMYTQTFTGQFNGNNKKITVQINENTTNVGLFSQVDGSGIIDRLIVDGYIIGGPNSENVGGIVGQLLGGLLHNNINLASVTGTNPTSSVGGIIGSVDLSGFHNLLMNNCANNGTITGGQYLQALLVDAMH